MVAAPEVWFKNEVAKRERYLFVCTNERPIGAPLGSCARRGAKAIHAAIKAELTLRKLAALEVRACTSSCLDLCWAGPVVMVSPGGTVYGRLTEGDVSAFVDALESGVGLERWTLPPADFDKDTAGPSLPELPEPPSPSGTT